MMLNIRIPVLDFLFLASNNFVLNLLPDNYAAIHGSWFTLMTWFILFLIFLFVIGCLVDYVLTVVYWKLSIYLRSFKWYFSAIYLLLGISFFIRFLM